MDAAQRNYLLRKHLPNSSPKLDFLQLAQEVYRCSSFFRCRQNPSAEYDCAIAMIWGRKIERLADLTKTVLVVNTD